ncbi:SDR family NAD(P)-dependent oxidoreductase [Aquabacterium sp.]|uniref:SDR family NAD(P)-dependent oxidoreductase n=1 Tax=Aquabacterium sp. TaxID=1872578 RepID=UPI0040376FD8
MFNVVITGVSSGIGHALAKSYLDEGHNVFGFSRSVPANLEHENFHHQSLDLTELDAIPAAIQNLLIDEGGISHVDYLYLHAGQFSHRIASLKETPQAEIDYLMRLNVWSNKAILDAVLERGMTVKTCMFSASIAGIRARAGNNSYALSKATLLMLAKLYALENKDIFFAVLGLCLVDTPMTRKAALLPVDERFADVKALLERSLQPGYVTTVDERVQKIRLVLEARHLVSIESGDFVEIRSL